MKITEVATRRRIEVLFQVGLGTWTKSEHSANKGKKTNGDHKYVPAADECH
jgi:hypothetical protein